MATKTKLTKEIREEVRAAVYKRHNIAHEFVALDDDDIRRTQVCSNSRSAKCSGKTATHARANKVYCATCYERCNKERSRIEVRAKAQVAALLDAIQDGADAQALIAAL